MEMREQQPAAAVFAAKSITTEGRSLQSFLASLTIAGAIFLVELLCWAVLRVKAPNIYTAHAKSSSSNPAAPKDEYWPTDLEIIKECGLDAYLFLRYLRVLLKIFVPLAIILLPVLLPVNLMSGSSRITTTTGLDRLSWTNVDPAHTVRYWAHLSMAMVVTAWVCYVFSSEIRYYTELRHQRSSQSGLFGTIVLLTDIPCDLRDAIKLKDLFKIYPGGVSAVVLNRNHKELNDLIQKRTELSEMLELAETLLIQKAQQRQHAPNSGVVKSADSFDSRKACACPLWQEYLAPEDREMIRIPSSSWIPFALFSSRQNDKIEYYRKELNVTNENIRAAQRSMDEQSIDNSALVQFNDPIGAHMASQSVQHPQPHTMFAHHLQETTDQIIWKNVSMNWWERYLRTLITRCLLAGLIVISIFPVAFTGLLSQLHYLAAVFPWLHWIKIFPLWVLALLQGVLPPCLLAAIMIVVPLLLRLIIAEQGTYSRVAAELSMQRYYFLFVFIQLFFVISVASSAAAFLSGLTHDAGSVAALLARNLPKASNYFFSYMLLQALSVSAGALLQLSRIVGYLIGYFYDRTPRQKWGRSQMSKISWGAYFPVYTNLAVIGLIYSVVSPLILLFNILTFGLFLAVQRYNILRVSETDSDTAGLVYPEALNQLFTGLYVMEIYLIGLFALVRDDKNRVACSGQVVIMVLVLFSTAFYQIHVNQGYRPLFKHLPLMLYESSLTAIPQGPNVSCETANLIHPNTSLCFRWLKASFEFFWLPQAADSTRSISPSISVEAPAAASQKPTAKTGEVDLRNDMLLAPSPTIWLPRDDLGLSTDEISETRKISKTIPISDQHAKLDNESRVIVLDEPPNASS